MKKRNTSNGEGKFKPISGFAKLKSMTVGDQIAGTYRGTFTTKTDYPKVNHLIELALPLTFISFDKKQGAEVEVNAQAGEVVALETTTVLSKELSANDVGKDITIIYTGRSQNKKPGQRPAYLVDIYDGLPEGTSAVAPVSAPKKAVSGFPFNKKSLSR